MPTAFPNVVFGDVGKDSFLGPPLGVPLELPPLELLAVLVVVVLVAVLVVVAAQLGKELRLQQLLLEIPRKILESFSAWQAFSEASNPLLPQVALSF